MARYNGMLNDPAWRKAHQPKTPGFDILLQPDTELGLAMLIAELPDGTYQPLSPASSINEAAELLEGTRGYRTRFDAETKFALWARGLDGDYKLVFRY